MDHTVLVVVVVYIAMIATAAASPVNFVSAGKISVFFVTSASPTRKIAADTCKNKGGILLADYAPAVQQMYMEPFVERGATYLCQSTSSGWNRNCYGAYTEGQATAIKDKCSLTRRENVYNSAFDAATEAKICPYRWSLGWFGRYTNDLGQVGVNFYDSAWADLAFDGSDPSQIPSADYLRNYERMAADASTLNIYAGGPANDYNQGVMWNASFQCFTTDPITAPTMAACIPPHGQQYIALGARQLSGASGGYYGVRVDTPDVPTSTALTPPNTPFVPNNYVVACQWQGVEASYYASTTLPPQPPMVPDWKEPTWIQSHWWIIYLVFAVVLLALLVAFIVWYECQLCAAKAAADDDASSEATTDMSASSDVASDVTTLHGLEVVDATTKPAAVTPLHGRETVNPTSTNDATKRGEPSVFTDDPNSGGNAAAHGTRNRNASQPTAGAATNSQPHTRAAGAAQASSNPDRRPVFSAVHNRSTTDSSVVEQNTQDGTETTDVLPGQVPRAPAAQREGNPLNNVPAAGQIGSSSTLSSHLSRVGPANPQR